MTKNHNKMSFFVKIPVKCNFYSGVRSFLRVLFAIQRKRGYISAKRTKENMQPMKQEQDKSA